MTSTGSTTPLLTTTFIKAVENYREIYPNVVLMMNGVLFTEKFSGEQQAHLKKLGVSPRWEGSRGENYPKDWELFILRDTDLIARVNLVDL